MLKTLTLTLLSGSALALAAPTTGTTQDPLRSHFCLKYRCKFSGQDGPRWNYSAAGGIQLLVLREGQRVRGAELGLSASSLNGLRQQKTVLRDYLAEFPSSTQLSDCQDALNKMQARGASTPSGKTKIIRTKLCFVAYAPDAKTFLLRLPADRK